MVAKKKTVVQPLRSDLPIYPIGVAAKLLGVHPRTLRIYEEEGLIQPDHKGARRLFSPDDIKWIFCLRSMIHDQGISIPGLKRLLALAPCWEIAECPAEVVDNCGAKVDQAAPRCIRKVGDAAAEKRAKATEAKANKSPSKKKVIRNK